MTFVRLARRNPSGVMTNAESAWDQARAEALIDSFVEADLLSEETVETVDRALESDGAVEGVGVMLEQRE